MRKNMICCDACATSEPTVDPRNGLDRLMPYNWFLVTEKPGLNTEREMHFCSPKCLKDWAEKLEIAEKQR